MACSRVKFTGFVNKLTNSWLVSLLHFVYSAICITNSGDLSVAVRNLSSKTHTYDMLHPKLLAVCQFSRSWNDKSWLLESSQHLEWCVGLVLLFSELSMMVLVKHSAGDNDQYVWIVVKFLRCKLLLFKSVFGSASTRYHQTICKSRKCEQIDTNYVIDL